MAYEASSKTTRRSSVSIPTDPGRDHTMDLLRAGYLFISEGCQRHQATVFQTRLLLQPTICMQGQKAVELLYDETLFQRTGAAPQPMQATLLGKGGVQGLDGDAHKHRKKMFMSLMTRESLGRMQELVLEECGWAFSRWQEQMRVELSAALSELLFRAACRWAHVPILPEDVEQRANDMAAMFDGAGGAGARHIRSRQARWKSERWAKQLIEDVRGGTLLLDESSALSILSRHRDLSGDLIPSEDAAVELLNLLRPTVAIGRYIVFGALSLHQNPEWRSRITKADDHALHRFVQEVRRFYPFFPFVAARTKRSFEWRGYAFPTDTRVLLDLYGTNHGTDAWEEPHRFLPDRFLDPTTEQKLVSQGGGDFDTHHRCAGEWMTIGVMKTVLSELARSVEYRVPLQDLSISLSRIPAEPASGFIIEGVRHMASRGERQPLFGIG